MRRYLGLGLVSLVLFAAGCARTDQQVAADVQKKISADSNIPDKQVTVSSTGGVVTLSGNVTSDAARNAAANGQPSTMPPPEPQAEGNNPPPAPRMAARTSPRARRSSQSASSGGNNGG